VVESTPAPTFEPCSTTELSRISSLIDVLHCLDATSMPAAWSGTHVIDFVHEWFRFAIGGR
jgi:hypothetical protein